MSIFKDFLIGSIFIALFLLAFYQLATQRSFGVYENGDCAYEQIDIGKATCPELMPDTYNSHIVSPRWGMK